jgi:HAD superfamily hydrolase (TIGR01509 family)
MLRALIFDCDGVLVDSEPVHLEMFQKVLAEEGIRLSKEAYDEKYLAMDDRGCFTAVFRDQGRPVTPERVAELARKKAAAYDARMSGTPPTFQGVVSFVRNAARYYPLAIASGALRHEVLQVVRALGIEPCFQCVVAAEDVKRGKPDPDAYLTAIEGLNRKGASPPLKPPECLVIEDSVHGVQAAKGAGMFCLAVTTSYPAAKLQQADWVAAHLGDVELSQIAKAMASPGDRR